jgi:hypothetical protein
MYVLSPNTNNSLPKEIYEAGDENLASVPLHQRPASPIRPVGDAEKLEDQKLRLKREPKMFERGGFAEEYTLRNFPYLDENVKDFVKRVKKYPLKKGHIFISVGHYRDDWCDYTIRQIFSKCKFCDNVFIGLSDQIWIPIEEYDCLTVDCQGRDADLPCIGPKAYRKNIRVVHLHEFEAKGPTWSRYVTSKLWRGEEYFLQIDAHTDFVQDWDEKLLNMIQRLPHRKTLVSHYPVSTPDQIRNDGVPWICNVSYDDYLNGLFSQNSNWYWINNHGGVPQPSPFIGAGFIFGPSQILIDAPYDRYLPFFFHGEEFLMAARLWTRGWDFFVPLENIVSHIYGHRNHSVFSDSPGWWVHSENSRKRAFYILGLTSENPPDMGEIEDLSLGNLRSMDAYQTFAGLNIKAKTIQSHCLDIWDRDLGKWVPDMTRWENRKN